MFLTITGKPGSGKSTICNILADKYGFQICSSGKIQRDIATDMGISTLDLNKLMIADPKYDRLIDKQTIQRSKKGYVENVIFDSRMAFHFVSDSFDIFTTIDPWEAAVKVMEMTRGNEEVYDNLENAKKSLSERGRIENERFQKLYGINTFDYNNFNLVIDTTWSNRGEIADLIYEAACIESSKKKCNILISPRSLYPTEKIERLAYKKNMKKNSMDVNNQPLQSVRIGEYHYLIGEKSHMDLLNALEKKIPFIEIQCTNMDSRVPAEKQCYVFQKLKQSNMQIWHSYEKWGDFQYKSYPHSDIRFIKEYNTHMGIK